MAVPLCANQPATAASITNKDNKTYQLTFIDRKGAKVQELVKEGRLEDVCRSGCILRIDKQVDGLYQLEGNEAVSIENGVAYYDGPALRHRSEPQKR